jgi:hypothetical protein
MIHATGRVAHTVAEALKNQPLALPVVLINVMCLAIVWYTLHSISGRVVERDKLLAEVIQKCK